MTMRSSEITIDFADTAQLADGRYMVFGGLRHGERVRILILVEDWDRFLLAFGGIDGPEARADLARIAANSEPFRTEVDGVPEYKVQYRASPI
jgi:hypothetical protein